MEIEHLLNPDFYCKKCLKSFKNKCSLTRHEKNVHSDLLCCNFCQSKLKCVGRPDAYKAHLKRCKAFNDQINIQDDSKIASLLENLTHSQSRQIAI